MDLTGTTGTANRFQHYELLQRADGSPWELGRGTMGVTYKAFDVNLRCEVALKVVNPALIHHPNARERFIREARAAAKLRHRNIASVYHLGNDGERFFYAMEFIDGETLDGLVRRQGPLSPDAALRVLLQVARALAAAARQGVIHRDIKPGNLMVVHEDDDDHRVVKLIDFGLARAVATDDDAGNLTANGFVGTPVYSSPEQMAEKPADGRSDIYSLGVTAWFLLAGKPPFNGTVASIFQQHATKPPPWEALPATMPAPVRALLSRMLEKNPARRPQSAVELRREIDACRERLSAVVPPADAPPAAAPRAGASTSDAGNAPANPQKLALPAVLPRELGPGMILKGRYELLRLTGEGNSGQVFQVKDRAAGDAARALKVFRAELTENTSKREIIAEEVRLIQAAPHPNLIRIGAFERLGSRALDFLVEEWLRGFTLLDLLAVRGGALSIVETLRILAQAAAAVDHAVGRDLDRLDLALHQLHVHFPARTPVPDDDAAVRGLMVKPMTAWPLWTLKVNPLGAIHGGLESSTWAGELTHLPGATPALDRDLRLDDRPATSAASYLRGLARTVYEVLGGAPGILDAAQDKRARGISLPALGEEANAVLQRAMSDDPAPYGCCRDFYAALATATGTELLPLPSGISDVPKTVAGASLPCSPAAVDRKAPASRQRTAPDRPADIGPPHESIAGLIGLPDRDADQDTFASKTSVWDRLTLVSDNGRRSGGWLPTLLVAGFLGVVSAVVIFAAVTRHPASTKNPRNHAANASPTRQTPSLPAASADIPPAAKPSPAAHPVANSSPARKETATPVPTTVVPARAETSVSTPPPLSPMPPARENMVKVRVETRPSGAEIRMSGKLLGTTPLDLTLEPGDHQLVAHYRNWPEVRHTLHLDSDQLTALDEIHMISPTLVPSADAATSPAGKNHHPTPSATPRRDGSHPSPIPPGNAIVHFPSPAASAPASSRGPEPFLAQPTPVRRARAVTLSDPDETSDPAPRRRPPEPPPLQSEDGAD